MDVTTLDETHARDIPKHSFLTRTSSSFLRAEMARRALQQAKFLANASPIPLDAPVTQTTFPANFCAVKNLISF